MTLEKMYLEMTEELKKKSVMFDGSFSFEGDNRIVIKSNSFTELKFVIDERDDGYYTFLTIIEWENPVSIIRFKYIELDIHYDISNSLLGVQLQDESGKGVAAVSFV